MAAIFGLQTSHTFGKYAIKMQSTGHFDPRHWTCVAKTKNQALAQLGVRFNIKMSSSIDKNAVSNDAYELF